MERKVTLESPAKVNLYLAVLGRRDDGYHDIETLFQTVSLADTITVRVEEYTGEQPSSRVRRRQVSIRRVLFEHAGVARSHAVRAPGRRQIHAGGWPCD